MPQLPPLDMHAHVSADVTVRDLESLGAVVFVATRSVEEFSKVANRTDRVTVWGVGCHPSLVSVQRRFDSMMFRNAMKQTAFVSEIGLDGSSRVPMEVQRRTLQAIFSLLSASPRLASVHSNQACGEVLDELTTMPSRAGVILHWWLGSESETARAVSLGAYFSVNYSMVRASDVWKTVPLERVLTETDHPSGDRFSGRPRQPGRVQPVEEALASLHGITALQVRQCVWRNFATVVSEAAVLRQLPPIVAAMLQTASSKTIL